MPIDPTKAANSLYSATKTRKTVGVAVAAAPASAQASSAAQMPSSIPPQVDIDANIRLARQRGTMPARLGGRGPEWFRDQVKDYAPWDYKRQNRQYEDFGNFNYGATGAAFGFSEETLLRMAGRAQKKGDPTWGEKPSTEVEAYFGFGGTAPFGDEPKDQFWIKQGILYYQQKHGHGP